MSAIIQSNDINSSKNSRGSENRAIRKNQREDEKSAEMRNIATSNVASSFVFEYSTTSISICEKCPL